MAIGTELIRTNTTLGQIETFHKIDDKNCPIFFFSSSGNYWLYSLHNCYVFSCGSEIDKFSAYYSEDCGSDHEPKFF